MNWPSDHQTISRYRPQIRGKYFVHQSLVLRVDNPPLVELAHMFYKVRLTIVNGEHKLMEPPRKFGFLYLARER